MLNGIILTVDLKGKPGKIVDVEETINVRHGEIILQKVVKFKKRIDQPCVRKTHISSEVVNEWVGAKAPSFIKEFIWKKLTKPQRLKAWVERFDEGYGVTYQEL